MVLRKSFYIRWSAGRSPWVHEVNPGRDPSTPCLAFTFSGPQTSELINCKGNSALVPFPNGFLVVFPTKQCSQVYNSTLFRFPNKPFWLISSFEFGQYDQV